MGYSDGKKSFTKDTMSIGPELEFLIKLRDIVGKTQLTKNLYTTNHSRIELFEEIF